MYDPSQLYIDPILTNFATGYRDPQYFADVLAPQTRVATKSGQYRVFDRSNRIIYPDLRGPGTVANEIRGRKWSTDVFSVTQHSLQSPVLDEERRELASQGGLSNPVFGGALQINLEEDATALVVGSLQRKHELQVATAVGNPANYPTNNKITLSGTSQFNDYTGGVTSTSDPVTVILNAVRQITNSIGLSPNVMVLPAQGSSYIENHPRVIDRFKTFTLTMDDAWRRLSGFDGQVIQIPVNSDVYNTADNVEATESLARFWGKNIIIAYVDQSDGMNIQTFMKTFVYPQLGGATMPIDRWREEARKADLFRATWEYDIKIVNSAAGYLIQNAFASTLW